jgi:hypothetical protein
MVEAMLVCFAMTGETNKATAAHNGAKASRIFLNIEAPFREG